MAYFAACALVFLLTYFLNILYITVFYHRGLTHGAVELRPYTRRFAVATGNWVTGLDPKAWSAMHRLHHAHSDTELDPHSPSHNGLFALMLVQLRSYNRVLRGLIKHDPKVMRLVPDLDFEVNWLNRKRMWLLPYALHAALALILALTMHAWLLGAAYWLGMMSHPIQGWMVNALAHRFGYRNFDTTDNSRNNTAVAWLVFGEGYQNNHHQHPQAARFSLKPFEVDAGYGLCLLAERLGMLDITEVSAPLGSVSEVRGG